LAQAVLDRFGSRREGVSCERPPTPDRATLWPAVPAMGPAAARAGPRCRPLLLPLLLRWCAAAVYADHAVDGAAGAATAAVLSRLRLGGGGGGGGDVGRPGPQSEAPLGVGKFRARRPAPGRPPPVGAPPVGAPPAPAEEAAATAAPEEAPEPVQHGEGFITLMLLLVVAVALGGIYVFIYMRYAEGTEQRVWADYLLCCWRDLYVGRAFPVYNVIFSPVILLIHAVTIYCWPCFKTYCARLSWRICGAIGCVRYFDDLEFPPNDTSLGSIEGDFANQSFGKNTGKVKWVRAHDFSRADVDDKPEKPILHDSSMNLFEGEIESADVLQGALGDCWLTAALAALAEHPGAIQKAFLTKELDPRGKYSVRLFDFKLKKFKVITVDDYVPCVMDPSSKDKILRDSSGQPVTFFTHPHGNEIWAMIIEKAVAKLCGSYAAMEGGFTEWGIACITGGKGFRFYRDAGSKKYQRQDLVFKRLEALDGKGAVAMEQTIGKQEDRDADEFFELLTYYHRNGAVLCCSGVDRTGESLGLVEGHAYSVLQVTRSTPTFMATEYIRFLQIRNPWGSGRGEWKGPWSDESDLWVQHPYVSKNLAFEAKDDGAFWMEWDDVVKYFDTIGVIDMDLDINSMHTPPYPTVEIVGPLKGCLKGCFDYWCRCDGAGRFFCNHAATDGKVREEDIHKKVGCDAGGCYFRLCDTKAKTIAPQYLKKKVEGSGWGSE